MKKNFITALIVLICTALVGLIAIQIYWIQNSIALRDAQFRQSVKTAIVEFVHILEREENQDRMKRFEKSRKIYSDIDSISKARPKSRLYITYGENNADTAFIVNESGEYAFEFSKPSKTANIFEPNPRKDSFGSSGGWLPDAAFDQSHSELLLEVMARMLGSEMGSDFLGRHSVHSLDTLIENTLKDFGGINADYHFGIFDLYDNVILVSDSSSKVIESLKKDGFRAKLFPSDLVQEPLHLRVWFPRQESYLLKSLWPLLFASAIFMLTVIFAFGYSIRTILYQKKVSAIKNDFINNMTHELKTPIATISLACEALSDPVMSKSETRVNHFLKMIRDENKRLGVLVENVLRSAVLDRGEMKLSREKVDIHEVILAAIRNIELQAHQKGGSISMALAADISVIKGDKVHLTNVIYNLLDNAIKYSAEGLNIDVSTSSTDDFIEIKVADNGIGIKKEDQERIFEKLFRVHTGDVHDIKGFGLGLSYVKMIIEKHHGTVSVYSEFGKGSKFKIQLPFDYDI